MKDIYKMLQGYNIELVDDIEYFDKCIEGIVVYFENGEAIQVFEDIDNKVSNNKYVVVNEYLSAIFTSNSVTEMSHYIIDYIERKTREINGSDDYITIEDFILIKNRCI